MKCKKPFHPSLRRETLPREQEQMNANHRTIQKAIGEELAATRARFHSLLASLSEEDFQKQSLNPGWTNGEILAPGLMRMTRPTLFAQ